MSKQATLKTGEKVTIVDSLSEGFIVTDGKKHFFVPLEDIVETVTIGYSFVQAILKILKFFKRK